MLGKNLLLCRCLCSEICSSHPLPSWRNLWPRLCFKFLVRLYVKAGGRSSCTRISSLWEQKFSLFAVAGPGLGWTDLGVLLFESLFVACLLGRCEEKLLNLVTLGFSDCERGHCPCGGWVVSGLWLATPASWWGLAGVAGIPQAAFTPVVWSFQLIFIAFVQDNRHGLI